MTGQPGATFATRRSQWLPNPARTRRGCWLSRGPGITSLEILAGQSDGDESRSGLQSVPTLINRTRGERHDRYLHLRHLFHPRRLRLLHRHANWADTGASKVPSSSTGRLALYSTEQRRVFGANTYRQFAQLLGSSTEPDELDPVNARMRSLPATVVSSTLEGPLDWPDATVVSGDAVDIVARLKEESEVPLRSHGSLSLNRALMAAGLVDYVQLTLFPAVSGQTGAEPIFQGAADFDLELVESQTLDRHILELIYRPTPH